MMRKYMLFFFVAFFPMLCSSAFAQLKEPESLRDMVSSGKLPAMAERLPSEPLVVKMASEGRELGHYGGSMNMLMSNVKDIRMMVVFSYARLVGFDEHFELKPDILASVDVEEGRIFTLHIRPGHKWSDGHLFTAEDFRYFWDDVALNAELSRTGPPQEMLVNDKLPLFEIIDPLTVRYSWETPNPLFLPSLAGASANYIYLPAHYMKQFHVKYADPKVLAELIKTVEKRNWTALHTAMSRQYRPENPDLPSLDPWINTVTPPSEQFVFVRNPYFHRVDESGQQLPYIDSVKMRISSSGIIAAKTGSGESDLQARYLLFDDYTFLKQAEKRGIINVSLWREGTGSSFALLPNLNANDVEMRTFMRNSQVRRALSLGIDRHEINQQFFFGLAKESADTVLEASPLYKPEYASAFSDYDPARANELLDSAGYRRGEDGIRRMTDGRKIEIIVEYAGTDRESDILELIKEYWGSLGINIYQRGMQLDNMRRRIHSGDTTMSIWTGLSVGLATADLVPDELAPATSGQGTWPKWGEYIETHGKAGEKIDMPVVQHLADLYGKWRNSDSTSERTEIWHELLSIHASEVFTIGTVNSTLQPVVINRELKNVPKSGIYTFSPTSYFGIYKPDTFFFAESDETQ